MLSCQKLAKSVLAKSHSVKGTTRAFRSGVHKGAECRKDIMDKLSIPGGTHTSRAFRLKDNKRLWKADTQAMAKEKKRRQAVELVRTRREEALQDLEGITYEAGGF